MSNGLKVFDLEGRAVVDIQDRLPRVYSTHTVNAIDFGPQSGFVSVPGMTRDGRWLVVSGASSIQLSYFHCVTGNGGFSWWHNSFQQQATCQVTVFKLF